MIMMIIHMYDNIDVDNDDVSHKVGSILQISGTNLPPWPLTSLMAAKKASVDQQMQK